MIYLELLLGFLQVGCFAFGGAYAAIPLIRDIVLSYGWISEARLTDLIAISESTPGPIMVNLATYIGSDQAGLFGALLATGAVVLPSFAVTLLLAVLLKTFLKNPYVQAVLRGIKPCVVGVVLATGILMTLKSCFPAGFGAALDMRAAGLAAALICLCFFWKKARKKPFNPIALIAVSAVAGCVLYGV